MGSRGVPEGFPTPPFLGLLWSTHNASRKMSCKSNQNNRVHLLLSNEKAAGDGDCKDWFARRAIIHSELESHGNQVA